MTKDPRLAPPDEPRRRGRPRVEPHQAVTTWLPVGDYDRLLRLAQAHDASVSATVRQLLILRVTEE
jgi:hypothetical protein